MNDHSLAAAAAAEADHGDEKEVEEYSDEFTCCVCLVGRRVKQQIREVEGGTRRQRPTGSRLDQLCCIECWPIMKVQANRVEVAELRMMRWTCGKTMVDMIPNGAFRAALDVDSIIDKMREGRLRWFGHVKRRPQTAPVRRVEAMVVEGLRRRVLEVSVVPVFLCALPVLPFCLFDNFAALLVCSACCFAYALFSFSIPEHLPYAHVHWPPGSRLFTSEFILGVGVGSVYIFPPPYPA
nr:polyprotein, putative [Tanacetum cinerariifolium]